MNLIDNYVYEIGRRLPEKNRTDIEAEIRSALQDLLDERSRQEGKPIDDEMVFAALKEYGAPEKVADSYRGERYLIGPRLYPAFEKVVYAVLPVTVVLSLVGLGFSLGFNHSTVKNVVELITQTIGNLIWSAVTSVGIIALVFAILERTVPEFGVKVAPVKEWDPHSLLKLTPPDHIKPGSMIADIFFTALAFVIFNFFPQLINMTYQFNGEWWVGLTPGAAQQAGSLTLLSPAFFSYLPAMDVLWILFIVLNILLLSFNRWQTWSRWAFIGLKVLTIGLAAVMLAGPSLVAVTASSLIEAGFPASPASAGLLVTLLNQVAIVALALTIIFSGVDIVKSLLQMFRPSIPILANGK